MIILASVAVVAISVGIWLWLCWHSSSQEDKLFEKEHDEAVKFRELPK